MKKMIRANIILITLAILLSVLVITNLFSSIAFVLFSIFIFLLEAIIFLHTFLLFKDETLKKIEKILRIYLLCVVPLFLIMQLYEWITGTVFIYTYSYQFFYLPTLIYPFILWIMLRGYFHRFMESHRFGLTAVISGITVIMLLINGFLVLLGTKTTNFVDFEEQEVKLVLVEESFLFSSNHVLYEKENALFMRELRHNGSWTCDDGCITNDPDAYNFVWIDDVTLEVSGGSLEGEVYFYLD